MSIAASALKRTACLALALHLLLLFLSWSQAAAADEAVIMEATYEADAERFSASFVLNKSADARIVHLQHPARIAVDFRQTLSAVAIEAPEANDFVSGVHHGLTSDDRYRIIYDLKQEVDAELKTAPAEAGELIEMVLQPAGAAGVSAKASSKPANRSANKGDSSPIATSGASRTLTICIDPGHGGVDEGAVSRSGTREKDVNLAMGFALRDALKDYPDIEVLMTREDDRFIPLDERAAIAQHAKADLFISLHADSIRYRDLRGATVYTLSKTASDELSAEIAAGENAADRFSSRPWLSQSPEILDILVDLTRRETVSFSEHFASSLVEGLGDQDIRLINRPKRSAGFRVLMAPDVPSVLLEAGFLSNKQDEKLLLDPDWRREVAEAVAREIVAFWRGDLDATEAGADANGTAEAKIR